VPVSEVSTLQSTQHARAVYDRWKTVQRPAYLTPSDPGTSQS
jgi:3D-(3,5/4)-trihydroxycyclohexane-1,2-dione acylhydrolase (decyclizing)